MTFTYDPRLNVAYLRFAEDSGHVGDSHQVTNDIIIDVDADGRVYGIELLNAREQLKMSNGKFQFINSLSNERREMPLPIP